MADAKDVVRLRAPKKRLTTATPEQLATIQTLLANCIAPVPTEAGYQLARDTLNAIINPKEPSQLEAGDWAMFLASINLSTAALKGYATLDSVHINHVKKLIKTIAGYVEDLSHKRPLNILMLASPGAGKSHFINCIAESLKHLNVRPVIFNMTALQRNEDLIPAVDAARNLKVEDHVPLVFLDEFDSKPNNFALLLPLLWDGELNLGQRDLKLGRSIIVLAGSSSDLPTIMDRAKNMKEEPAAAAPTTPKIVDLLSRINGGVIEIPTFLDRKEDIDRRLDKACVAVLLLKRKFGDTLRSIPLALLRFIVNTEFRYGVRSIDHLIDQIPFQKGLDHLKLDALDLPMEREGGLEESSLIYHILNKGQVAGVLKSWQNAKTSIAQVPVGIQVPQDAWWVASADDDEMAQMFVDRVEAEMDGSAQC